MKILACSDIHLGRIPLVGEDEQQTGSSSWEAVVQKAIQLEVDALVLCGDVVEQEHAWLSVYEPLLSGLDRLKVAGIKVIAVGGNHDYDVFPRLAQESDAITLLGLGGTWERCDLGPLRIIGWSFPSSHTRTNPLKEFDASLLEGAHLTLGLLHTDAGVQTSVYAPTQSSDFTSSTVGLWMLGHIHKPDRVANSNAYYCGSPFALDKSEMGRHGAWLLKTIADSTWDEPQCITLCPYRYERLSVDISGLSDLEQVRSKVTSSARDYVSTLQEPTNLYLTPVFVGTLSPSVDLSLFFGSFEEREKLLFEQQRSKVYLVSQSVDETELEVDLGSLAQGQGPAALLARMLLDEDEMASLAQKYQSLDRESYNSSAFGILERTVLDTDDAIRKSRQAGRKLLKAMLVQTEGGF